MQAFNKTQPERWRYLPPFPDNRGSAPSKKIISTKIKMVMLTLSTLLISNIASANLSVTPQIELGELKDCWSRNVEYIDVRNQSTTQTLTVTPQADAAKFDLNVDTTPFTLEPNQYKRFRFGYTPNVNWHNINVVAPDNISFAVEGSSNRYMTTIHGQLTQPVVCHSHLELGNHPDTNYPNGLPARAYAWGDIDSDGDLDLVAYLVEDGTLTLAGMDQTSSNANQNNADESYGVTPNYRGQLVYLINNDSELDTPRLISNDIAGGYNSLKEMEFIDIDGDNQVELVYRTFVSTPAGDPELAEHRTFYVAFNRNFTQQNNSWVTELDLPRSEYDLVWADFDQDGDVDVGVFESIYGEESYTIWVQEQPFEFVKGQDLAMPSERKPPAYDSTVIDVDSDGDLDILLSGFSNRGSNYQRHLLRNMSESNPSVENLFVKEENFLVTGPYITRHAFTGDFDSDGKPDIASDGLVHRIDSDVDALYTIYGEQYSDRKYVAWADFNNDGQYDVMHGERSPYYSKRPTLTLFPKNVGEAFTHIRFPFALFNSNIRSDGEANMNGATADFDRDGRMEMVTTDGNIDGDLLEVVAPANTRPEPPTSVPAVTVFDGSQPVVLSWGSGSDQQTPTASLTYNVYVRAINENGQPAATFVVSPQANLDTGIGYVDVNGNAGYSTDYTLRNLPVSGYEWGVQTVDTGWARSKFTHMGFFDVTDGQCEPDLKITGVTEDDRLDPGSNPNSNERAREYFVQYFVVNESYDCDSGPIEVLATTANYSKLRASFGMGADVRAVAQPEFDSNSGSISVQALPARKSFVVTLQYYDYEWGNAVHHDYDIVEPVLSDESRSHFEIDLPAIDEPVSTQAADARLSGITYASYRSWGGYTMHYFMVTNEGEADLTNIKVQLDQEGVNYQYKYSFGTASTLSRDGQSWTIPKLVTGQKSYLFMYSIDRSWSRSRGKQMQSSAEIVSMDQKDIDSQPGNGYSAYKEDDVINHIWTSGRSFSARKW